MWNIKCGGGLEWWWARFRSGSESGSMKNIMDPDSEKIMRILWIRIRNTALYCNLIRYIVIRYSILQSDTFIVIRYSLLKYITKFCSHICTLNWKMILYFASYSNMLQCDAQFCTAPLGRYAKPSGSPQLQIVINAICQSDLYECRSWYGRGGGKEDFFHRQ